MDDSADKKRDDAKPLEVDNGIPIGRRDRPDTLTPVPSGRATFT
jgi:hypothetical protein